MRATMAVVVLLLTLPAGLTAQGGRGRQMQMNRRAQLESRVVQRFVEQSSREIGLDENERRRVGEWLESSQEKRRVLAADATETRRRLMDAVLDPRTDDATFRGILDDLDALREREHQQWKDDQDQLKSMLAPRKRAELTVRLLRLQDAIRTLIERRDSTGGTDAGLDEGGVTPGGASAVDPFIGHVVTPPSAPAVHVVLPHARGRGRLPQG